MKKGFLLYGFCLMGLWVAAQKKKPAFFNREITLTTENDAYLFRQNDAYYTNGFFLTVRKAATRKTRKLVEAYQLGQAIYTPFKRKTTGPADIDRPYCGFLFLEYSQTSFSKEGVVLQVSGRVGEVGPASLGEAVQNSYHSLLRYSKFTGWQYQVRNALGIDLGFLYAHTILEDSTWIKLVPVAQGSIGMNMTNAGIGSYLCIGSFEKNANSALWNARVQTKETPTRRNHELFVFWYPQVIYQVYNATIQGGLFSKGNGAVLAEPERWMFQQSVGVCFAEGRWTSQLALVHQSKEAVTQQNKQNYGSITLSYRL